MVQNYSPKELLDLAQMGKKLKPKERHYIMVWLEKSGEIESWQEDALAKALGCRVVKLRDLRRQAQNAIANLISPAEAMGYMTEYLRHSDLLIAQAIHGVKNAPANTQLHQGYMRLLMEASSEKVTKLQSIGVIPKELGRLTTVSEEWTAVISPEGVVSNHRALGDGDPNEPTG
jgi:hypothetical protein